MSGWEPEVNVVILTTFKRDERNGSDRQLEELTHREREVLELIARGF
jgi:DNA-binding NarL/FixJ family response regulator